MKELFATWTTEHEFGQRSAGVHVSENLDVLQKEIARIHSLGDKDGYFRCSEPKKIFVEDATWKRIAGNMRDGILWIKKLPEGFYREA